MAKSELHRDYILELESELQEFEKKADASTKRMQMMVYPAMVAFFILAAFGFYLIYSLTSDVRRMADTFVGMSGSIEHNMDSIAGTMGTMTGKMDSLVTSTETMSSNVGSMTSSTNDIVNSMSGMRSATYDMAASTNNMQRDMWSLNKNISTPLSFMNSFLPWKDSQSMPFQGSSEPLPRSQFSPPLQQQGYGNPYGGAGNMIPVPLPLPNYMPPVGVPENIQPQTIDGQGSMVDSLFPGNAGTVSIN
ncbi:MAG: hypothetical protein V3U64_04605 [Cocleimonas sp.]